MPLRSPAKGTRIHGLNGFGQVTANVEDDMKKTLWLIAVGWLLVAPAHAQRTFYYVNPVNARHVLGIQSNPALFIFHDIAVDAEECPPSDRFICINSSYFNFAFPRNRSDQGKAWVHRGITYEPGRRETMVILGKPWPVQIVESVQGASTLRFAFSEHAGLLAISMKAEDTAATFLTTNAVGFGARQTSRPAQRDR